MHYGVMYYHVVRYDYEQVYCIKVALSKHVTLDSVHPFSRFSRTCVA
jgi:hypothetical protein